MSNGECIAANVARLRLDRQLTQGQLAARAGISRMALGKIERGAVVPRAGTLADLAAALAVPIGEFGGTGSASAERAVSGQGAGSWAGADPGGGHEMAGCVLLA